MRSHLLRSTIFKRCLAPYMRSTTFNAMQPSSTANQFGIPTYIVRYNSSQAHQHHEEEMDVKEFSSSLENNVQDVLKYAQYSPEKERELFSAFLANPKLLQEQPIIQLIQQQWKGQCQNFHYFNAHINHAQGDYQQYLENMQHSAHDDSFPPGVYELALLYSNGLTVDGKTYLDQNLEEAWSLLKKASQFDVSSAHFNMYQFLHHSFPVKQIQEMEDEDRKKLAMDHLEKSVKAHKPLPVAQCQYALHLIYDKKEHLEGYDMLIKTANNGYIPAAVLAARESHFNIDLRVKLIRRQTDSKEESEMARVSNQITSDAISMLQSASTKGSQDASFVLGTIYESVLSLDKARDMFQTAVEQKHPKAFEKLAYYHTQSSPEPHDLEKATNLLKQGADLGDFDSYALYALHLTRGFGIEANVEEGTKILENLCQQKVPNALYYMGKLVKEGNIKESKLSADEYLKHAVEKDQPEAIMYCASLLLEEKTQDPKLDEESRKKHMEEWAQTAQKACNLGSKSALIGLSRFVPDDVAFSLLSNAASFGSTVALVRIAEMFQEGKGIDSGPDKNKAKELFTIAANAGNRIAAERLKALEQEGSASESKEGESNESKEQEGQSKKE